MIGDIKHTPATPLPWWSPFYAQSGTDLETMKKHGITPTRLLTNEGQRPILSGGELRGMRVALVDSHTRYKRGEGWRAPCDIREQNTDYLVHAAVAYSPLVLALRKIADQTDLIRGGILIEHGSKSIARAVLADLGELP